MHTKVGNEQQADAYTMSNVVKNITDKFSLHVWQKCLKRH